MKPYKVSFGGSIVVVAATKEKAEQAGDDWLMTIYRHSLNLSEKPIPEVLWIDLESTDLRITPPAVKQPNPN